MSIRESTDSGFRRAVLSSEGRSAEQARRILDEQMKVAFFEGQRGFNLARSIVCGAFLARELVFVALGGAPTRLDVFVIVMLTIRVPSFSTFATRSPWRGVMPASFNMS